MKHHPVAVIFPLMGDDELKRLAADIEANGLHESIVTYDDKILDGRNREAACKNAGVTPKYRAYRGSDPLAYVLSANLHRRHLNASQRAMVAARMANLRRGQKRADVSFDTSAVTLADAAQAVNVGRATVARAKAVLDSGDAEAVAEIESGDKNLSQVAREARQNNKRSVPLPKDKYTVLYADPPWSYSDKCDNGAIQAGGAEKHYPSMTLAELKALAVKDLAAEDAVLFLWVTSPLLPWGLEVAQGWGFAYKASFIWDKIKHNMGHYNSVRHEFLLLCTRGSSTPQVGKLFDSVQSIERTPKHSEKPEEFRKIIDTLYPKGKRIELFARTKVGGWDAWGNEVV